MQNLWPSPAEITEISTHQRAEYAKATRGPVGIIGGNPGVGKTWLTAHAIRAVIAEHGSASIAVAAPTGKAAQRVNELLDTHGIHGITATTIHRLLGVTKSGLSQNDWGFRFNSETPLPRRFVFIDEASMLGTGLAASLLAALAPGTHLLFIGDFAQLPPVEHGKPLRDMIAAGLPYGELTETHRNGGDIVEACRDMKAGRPFRPSLSANLALGYNLCHVEVARPTQAVAALDRLIRSVPPTIDPMWGVQVLCAVNENTEVSRKPLNRMLQKMLNPNGLSMKEIVEGVDEKGGFRLGDKVICLKNQIRRAIECPHCHAVEGAAAVRWTGKVNHCCCCDRTWLVDEMPEDFVANGEIGRVTHLERQLMYVAIDAPERTVRVHGIDLQNFDLAYAITTHRAQGSQWPVVIVMADGSPSAGRVCSFEWHRTAISRAEKMCFTVGQLAVIHRHCRKSGLVNRKTFLTELLKEPDEQVTPTTGEVVP